MNNHLGSKLRSGAELLAALAAAVVSLTLISGQHEVLHPDLNVVWLGYRHLLEGISPYPAVIDQPLPDFGQFGNGLYLHPPGSLLALSWIGYFDRELAASFVAWTSALGVPYVLLRYLRRSTVPLAVAACFVLLLAVSRPWLRALEFGNIDAIALILLLIAFGLLLETHTASSTAGRLLAALLLGAAIAVKPTVALIALAPLALGWRGFRVVFLAGCVTAFMTVVGFVFVPNSGRFISVVLPFLSDGQPGVQALRGSIPSIPATFGYFGSLPRTGLVALSTACLLGTLWLLRGRLRGDLVATAALLAPASLLIAGYSFDTYQQFLVFAFPVVWLAIKQRIWLAVGCYLLAVFTFSALYPGFTDDLALNRFLGMRLLLGNALVMVASMLTVWKLAQSPEAAPQLATSFLRIKLQRALQNAFPLQYHRLVRTQLMLVAMVGC